MASGTGLASLCQAAVSRSLFWPCLEVQDETEHTKGRWWVWLKTFSLKLAKCSEILKISMDFYFFLFSITELLHLQLCCVVLSTKSNAGSAWVNLQSRHWKEAAYIKKQRELLKAAECLGSRAAAVPTLPCPAHPSASWLCSQQRGEMETSASSSLGNPPGMM